MGTVCCFLNRVWLRGKLWTQRLDTIQESFELRVRKAPWVVALGIQARPLQKEQVSTQQGKAIVNSLMFMINTEGGWKHW